MDKIRLNKLFFFLLFFIVISGFSSTALSREPDTAAMSPPGTPKIAVILPLSGPFADYGEALQQGYMLGFAKVTATANIVRPRYRIEYLDREASPETACTLINMLSAEGEVAIATGTPLNATAWTAVRACEKNGLPYLVAGADQDNLIGKDTTFSFRLTQKKSSLEQLLTKYMATRKTKIKSMGIIYTEATADAVNKARRIRRLGTRQGIDLTIWKSWKEYSKTKNNFYDLLNTIREHQPQILFLITGQTVANRLWEQGRRLEIMPPATISIPVHCLNCLSRSDPKAAPRPAAQLIYASPWSKTGLNLSTGEDISPCRNRLLAQGSAAAEVILSCLQKSRNLSAPAVIQSMESLKTDTVYGKVSFSSAPSGHQNKLTWYLCRNGEDNQAQVIFPVAGSNKR